MSRNPLLLVFCAVAAVAAGAAALAAMLVGGERDLLLVGATTDAHHQIEMACETCHTAPPFSDAKAAQTALNKACRDCHEDELEAADDSHPRKTFRNPRMAAYWESLDARLCTTCHVEHRPEITRKGAVTVAMDFCVACHSEGEQDVREARPSHAELEFESCASAGCHNYHDNRALYAEFLVRHADEPWLAAVPVHALSARLRSQAPPGDMALGLADAVAPADALADSSALADWAGSGHAAAGVNCAACHAPDVPRDAPLSAIEAQWVAEPALSVCKDCHKPQADTFVRGRHGMRQHPLVAAPRDPAKTVIGAMLPETVAEWLADPPYPAHMTVGEARLPMRDEAAHEVLDCGTCHRPHAVDIAAAAAEACMTCHDDTHSRAWTGSPHHALWLAELSGEAAPGTGVSCATCHMAKVKRRGQVVTNHNQNDTLRPNEKMIRSVCLDCHGLGFAIDALADDALVARNFRGRPAARIESIEWAVRHSTSVARSNRQENPE